MKNLFKDLQAAATEEEVKHTFANFFNIPLDTRNKIDLYTPQILFEFKFDSDLNNLQNRAKFFAQALYYIRRLKYENDPRTPSNSICVVTKFAAAILTTDSLKNYYLWSKTQNFDWDLAPSKPCPKLVAALTKEKILRDCHVYDFKTSEEEKNFIAEMKRNFQLQLSLFDGDKKIIDEFNFFEIFEYWQKDFGKYVAEEDRKPSEYFITDIENGKSVITDEYRVLFRMNDGSTSEKKLPMPKYKFFWRVYAKIYAPAEIISIRQKMDVLTEINQRRFTGEFFTPVSFAKKAVEYLSRTLGTDWYKKGNFRLWDMAAGTGNLEFALPPDALKYCYISTLLEDDAAYCQKIFKDATVFQYDYLNDDIEFFKNPQLFQLEAKMKMPKNLREDLDNPKIKWIIFINPPYATPTPFHRGEIEGYQEGVSSTEIQKLMKLDNLGESSRELYVQFLYRISKEFKDRKVWLGIFSSLKYIKSEQGFIFRNKIFPAKFERGFVFSSKNFQGCKGSFPIGFLIWNLAEKISVENQKISLDVFNNKFEKVAKKNIRVEHSDDFLNKWITRPKVVKKFPPITSGVKIAYDNKNPRNRIAENFLASFLCSSNDFSNANYTAFFSGPAVSHGGYSITPENFEKSLITHLVRRIENATWLNDRDQFMQPTKPLGAEFITDAVIWSLFAPSNQTVSLRNVKYEGQIYQMPNNLYPFKTAEIKSWRLTSEIAIQLEFSQEERFAALWLEKHRAEISAEGRAVLARAKEIYKIFYENLDALDCVDLKIENWDVGWYQIRMAVKDFIDDENAAFQKAFKILGEKLLPQIYELGFLRDEVIYF